MVRYTSCASDPTNDSIAYKSHLELDNSLIGMDSGELVHLMDPCNIISQLLLAHVVALYLIMRPIACHERKNYTVTMYGIRMTSWIGKISTQMEPEHQESLKWPQLISQLHAAKRLEEYTLAPNR